MPHHPSEETAHENITDKVARESKEGGASDHPRHDENTGAYEQGDDAGINAFNQAKRDGPQIVDKELPPAKSKEELQDAAKALNS